MSTNVSDDPAAGPKPSESRYPPGGGNLLTSSGTESQDIQVEDEPQVPFSNGGTQPTTPNDARAQEAPDTVQHYNTTCYLPGCERIAEASQMSEDGRINRVCAGHKKPAVLVTSVTRADNCEIAGCERTPRYGVPGQPLSFCQGHKRAGMYTCREGELFVATRDGSAVRDTSDAPASAAADATDTSRQAPNPAPLQEPRNELSMPVLPRKGCQEPGCEAQPSYGVPGSGNPQYCSSHKNEGLISLKNRPCVQPGCNTRPHYGISRGKAVYCVTHKLDGMVHLLKEAKTLQKKAHALRRRKSRLNVAAKKARMEREAKMEKAEANSDDPTQEQEEGDGGEVGHEKTNLEEEEGEGSSPENQNKGKRPARAKSVPRKLAAPTEAATQGKACETAASGAAAAKPSPSPSPPSSSSSPRMSSGQKQKKQHESRPEDPAGLAPSDEMRLFQEARESARAMAQASGSGRRARAPSRRVLEASGKLAGGSVQWMTKEKKEEHARRSQEIKEQRKAAAAAGLSLGHVIETITDPPGDDGVESGAGGGGSAVGGASAGGTSSGATSSSPTSSGASLSDVTSSSSASSGATSSSPAPGGGPPSGPASSGGFSTGAAASGGVSTGEEVPAARAFGTQLSQSQKMPAAAAESAASGGAERSSRDTANGIPIANEQGTTVTPAAAAETGAAVAPKRSNSSASDVQVDETRTPKRSRHANNGDTGSDGGNEKSGKAACESENCLKTAKYGINGIVRYCKKHQIFGMQKIVDEQ